MIATLWGLREKDFICENYGKLPVKSIAEAINRSVYAIQAKACELGLVSSITKWQTSNSGWSPEALQILKHRYTKTPPKELAKMLGHSLQAVYNMAWILGLSGKSREFQPKNIFEITTSLIDRYKNGESAQLLAAELGTTSPTLIRRLRILGVSTRTSADCRKISIKKLVSVAAEMRKDGSLQRRQSAGHQGVTIENWRGYKKSEGRRRQHNLSLTPEWIAWRRAIYMRDRHICVMCRKHRSQNRAHKYDPHHIIRKALRPDLMYDIDNGVTLCRPCHKKTFRNEEAYAPQFMRYVQALKTRRAS